MDSREPHEADPSPHTLAPTDEAILDRAITVGYKVTLAVTCNWNTAEQVAQDVAVQAMVSRSRRHNAKDLDAWLYRRAVRTALSERRRLDQRQAAGSHQDGERSPSHDSVRDPELQRFLDRLERLPAKQRAAMVLLHVFDVPARDIARALRIRTRSAPLLLSRGTEALRATERESP